MNCSNPTRNSKFLLCLAILSTMLVLGVPRVFAASATWTNAPADSSWTNVLNWIGGVVPGTVNNTANNGVDGSSVATFTNPIPLSLIGSASDPIVPDDGTIVNGKARMMSRLNFDGPNCGAYVFYSPSAFQPRTSTQPETGVLSLCVPSSATFFNGSFIGPDVVNPQTFLVPVQIRLPSSTTGQYGFTNNAISSDATYYFDKLWEYPDATTRGVTFIFAGSNTGTNTVAYLSQSANTGFTASCGIRKEGTGTWILSGANNFNTGTLVNIYGGTLIVKDSSAFGVANQGNVVVSNGVLQVDGITLGQLSVTLANGGNVRMNGTASVNGIALSAQAGNNATVSTTSASDVFTVGTGLSSVYSIVSAGAPDSVLNTAGPGTLIFSQSDTYVGKWSFNAATNVISNASALGTGADASVGSGAILDLTALGPSTFVPTTSGFGGSGTGILVGSTAAAVVADPSATIDLTGKNVNLTFAPTSASGDTTHPALYIAQGSLTLSGNTFFIDNASASPLGVGTYRLMQQASGAITSGGGYAVLVSGSGLASGTAGIIQVSGGNVDLVVSVYVPQNLTWTGSTANANWDVGADANWWDGSTQVTFNNSDNVTFNSIGSTNPSVNLVGNLGPATVTVDTSANDYTFSGSGQIVGATSLQKIGAGALILQNVNNYAGGTVVSNGAIRIGVNNAISATGAGDVAVYGSAVIDLNGFDNSINALLGDGTVDVQNGGTSTLTFGNNDKSGTFAGILQNTSGTLNIAKLGTGVETLTTSNAYTGSTTVSAGTLAVTDPNALGSGHSAIIVDATLDVGTDVNVMTLAGGGGSSIVNNSTATTNTITVLGSAATTFSGTIADGTGGGGLALKVLGGTLTFGGANTYTGGTIVGSGATLAINNGPAGMTGAVIASNAAALTFAGGGSTPSTPTSITTIDDATVVFTSGAEGKIWNSRFIGGATATNIYNGPVSAGGSMSFSNFLGRVIINSTNNFRFFNGGGTSGGADTTFEFQTGNVHTRDAQTVVLGSIEGGSTNCGIGGATGANLDTYIIGTKGIDNVFHGYISGSNNIVKAGPGKLVLDGVQVTVNSDSATFTNYFYAPLITYVNATTVSNGVLSLVVPNNLTNSTSFTLAGSSAVFDASQMGYISNQVDNTLTVTNQLLVTNGVFEIYNGQTASGVGTIWGHLLADSGSTINPGLPTGTLTVTNGVDLESATMNMNLNRTNAQTSSQLAAVASTPIVVNGGVLNVTNVGPDLVTGDVYQLFNQAITGGGFSSITLPASNALNTVQYLYQTNLTSDGSITVLQGVAPVATNPTNITLSVSGNTLNLSWPEDHTGWTLQVQTNSLSTGLGTNWYDVPGSAAINSTNIVMDPNNPTVFFRLKY